MPQGSPARESPEPVADDGANVGSVASGGGGGGSGEGDSISRPTIPWKPPEEEEGIPVSPDSGGRRRRKRDLAAEPRAGGGGASSSPDSGAGRNRKRDASAVDGGSVRPGGARRRKVAVNGEDNDGGAETRAEQPGSDEGTGGASTADMGDMGGGDTSGGDTNGGDTSSGDASNGEAGARGPDPDRPKLAWSGPLDELSPPSGRRLRKAASKCAPQEADTPKPGRSRQPSSAKKSRSAGAGAGSGARGQKGSGGGESEGAEVSSPAAVRKKKRGVAARENGDAEAATPRRRRNSERDGGGAATAGETESDRTKAPVEGESNWQVAGNGKGKKPAARGEGRRGSPSQERGSDTTGPPPAPSSVVSPAGGIATASGGGGRDQDEGRDRSPSVEVLKVDPPGTPAFWRGDGRGLFVDGDGGGGSVASRSLKNKRKRAGPNAPVPLEEDQGSGVGGGDWQMEEVGSTAACGADLCLSPSASTMSEQFWAAAAEVSSGDDGAGSEDNEADHEIGDGEGSSHRGGGRGDHGEAEAPGAVGGDAASAAQMAGFAEEQGRAKRLRTDSHVGLQGGSEVSCG